MHAACHVWLYWRLFWRVPVLSNGVCAAILDKLLVPGCGIYRIFWFATTLVTECSVSCSLLAGLQLPAWICATGVIWYRKNQFLTGHGNPAHQFFHKSNILHYTIVYYSMAPSTTIKVSTDTKTALAEQKLHPGETFEQVINRFLKSQSADDYLDEQTLLDMQDGLDDIKAGRVHTTKELKAELGL